MILYSKYRNKYLTTVTVAFKTKTPITLEFYRSSDGLTNRMMEGPVLRLEYKEGEHGPYYLKGSRPYDPVKNQRLEEAEFSGIKYQKYDDDNYVVNIFGNLIVISFAEVEPTLEELLPRPAKAFEM